MKHLIWIPLVLTTVACVSRPIAQGPKYTFVYTSTDDGFLLNDNHYGADAIAAALDLAAPANGVHVFVLRGSTIRELTIGDILAAGPKDPDNIEKRICYYFQKTDGTVMSFTPQDSRGAYVDRSFCPSGEEVVDNIGPFTSEHR